MGTRYSEAFVEQALVKVYSRSNRTVQSVAEGLNVNCHTVKNWMKREAVGKVSVSTTTEKRPHDWNAEEQLVALPETHGLSGEALQTWCCEMGYLPIP